MSTEQTPSLPSFYFDKLNDLLYQSNYYALLSQKYAERAEAAEIAQSVATAACAVGTLVSGYLGNGSPITSWIAITSGSILIIVQCLHAIATHVLKQKQKSTLSKNLSHTLEICFIRQEIFALRVKQGEATNEEIEENCKKVDECVMTELEKTNEVLTNERDDKLAEKAGQISGERMRRRFGCI
jgi:hypothetical protein